MYLVRSLRDTHMHHPTLHRRTSGTVHHHATRRDTSSCCNSNVTMVAPKSILGSKELSHYITSESWGRAIQLCESNPHAAKAWSVREGFFEGIKTADVLPLHEACANGAPPQVITALIGAYPGAVEVQESAYRRLPLHIACRKNANVEVIQILMTQSSRCALEADNLGRLPLHYAISNHVSDEAIDVLLQEPGAARGVDRRGWIPLHVACSVGSSTHVVQCLLEAYPESIVERTRKGTSAIKCARSSCASNREEVIEILTRAKQKFDENWRIAKRTDSDRIIV